MRKFITAGLVAATLALTLGASECSSVSHAPTTRAETVREVLADKGLTAPDSDAAVDKFGANICGMFRRATVSHNTEVLFVSALIARTNDLSLTQGAQVAGAYVGAYCPEEAS